MPAPRPSTPPRLLTIAGSDSGGGAGIQADLKTFAALGGYGLSVITAITAQNTVAVTAVHPVPAGVVAAQVDAVWEDIGVDAVKIGMLASAELVRTVAERLSHHLARTPSRTPVPVVLDPVMVAKSGDALLAEEAVTALGEHLLPLATLVTPNLPEAERLAGLALGPGASEDARWEAAQRVADLGRDPERRPPAVLLKGGHAEGKTVVDLLLTADGERHRYEHERLETSSTHGTGCTLSSALAAHLGAGLSLPEAVEASTDYLWHAIEAAFPLGAGHGPVSHGWRQQPLSSRRAGAGS